MNIEKPRNASATVGATNNRPPMKRVALAVLVALGITAALATGPGIAATRDLPTVKLTAPTGDAGALYRQSYADLVARIKPAVVNISTTARAPTRGPMAGPQFRFPPGSSFEDFFRRYFEKPQGPGWNQAEQAPVRTLGSGFIIDSKGWVITNNHVVEGADEITVTLDDGTRLPAELKGRDPKTDLAVLKVQSDTPLPSVEFGDSDSARIGDWVLAIGNPFGLGGSVTTGIISARGRDIRSGPFDDFIQIDASINRGNSGGPLFDTAGRVIGINTAIFSPNGGNVGIGFAIPSELAQGVITQLQERGTVVRGWLGVQIQAVNQELAESLELEEAEGAIVSEVVEGSPAAKAGIQVGDVVLRFGAGEVERVKDLPRLVAEAPVDEDVEVVVWRNGKRVTLDVVVGINPEDEQLAAKGEGSAETTPELGLALAPITPPARERFQLEESVTGALVVEVDRDSPAARNGVRPGDVIVRFDRQEVKNPEDVTTALRSARESKRKHIPVLVNRRGNQHFVTLPLA
ncbi:MAG: serine protease [Gammaproteobacteria bacterium]|nr:MAG: serine protease [Gammaproteobacteria bacterium]